MIIRGREYVRLVDCLEQLKCLGIFMPESAAIKIIERMNIGIDRVRAFTYVVLIYVWASRGE